jgi:hypothetical protein
MMLVFVLAAFCLTKSLLCNVAVFKGDAVYFKIFTIIRVYFSKDEKSFILTRSVSQDSRRLFQVFKEDSVQIPTQRIRIPSFHLDGPV